jgi:tRNA(fMet)-specific endonuclease VapC
MLDTNICIELLRKKSSRALQHIEKCSIGDICISSITLAELRHGVVKSSNFPKSVEILSCFLTDIEVFNFDSDAAISYGQHRAYLESQGTPIGPMDLLIAAHASSLDITLVTNNMREFKRVKGLKLENWIRN